MGGAQEVCEGSLEDFDQNGGYSGLVLSQSARKAVTRLQWVLRTCARQGYFAQKKQRFPRTLQ